MKREYNTKLFSLNNSDDGPEWLPDMMRDCLKGLSGQPLLQMRIGWHRERFTGKRNSLFVKRVFNFTINNSLYGTTLRR
jgi:hypothetical protein